MHHDASATNGLAEAVIVDQMLASAILPPDLDAESVGGPITGPEHEFVGIAIGVKCAIDRTAALELGVRPGLIDHQPFICTRMEIEPAGLELEFSAAAGDCGTLLIFRDEAEGGFACQRWIIYVSARGRVRSNRHQ